jgi:hypothetical protein
MIALRIGLFVAGLLITLVALRSAVRSLVLSRGVRDGIVYVVFGAVRRLFVPMLWRSRTYLERDRIMAFYAPVALLSLVPSWLLLVLIGFMFMYWSTAAVTWPEAFYISGSSLLTLGVAQAQSPTMMHLALEFAEATIGLMLVALLIAYLPTMYNAFSQREAQVTLLEVRAGDPPSALEMILRYHRNQGLVQLHETWTTWEGWFAAVDESHTSLAALVYFRSPQPRYSWVTAAGAVLDAASLTLAAVDIPFDVQAALCIRSGYLCLYNIAAYFFRELPEVPSYPDCPITVTREEFDATYDALAAAGVPLREDRDDAWLQFAGWRVNYDASLLALARLTMAPAAPWSSDRASLSAAQRRGLRG